MSEPQVAHSDVQVIVRTMITPDFMTDFDLFFLSNAVRSCRHWQFFPVFTRFAI